MATPTVAEITPAVGEVAAHILFRTYDGDGHQLGTFNDTTTPTRLEVEAKALDAAGYIVLKLGTVHTTWDGDLVAQARSVAARFAALYVEASLPDGNAPTEYFVDQLGRIARERLDVLLATARDNQPGSRPFTTIRLVGEGARPRGVPWSDRPLLAQAKPLRLTHGFRRGRR